MLSGLLVAPQYSLIQAIGEPPAFLGVLSACLGAGSIVASLVSSRLLRRLGEDRLALLGMINFVAGAGLRATGNLPCAVISALVSGFALPWAFLAIRYLTYRQVYLAGAALALAATVALAGLSRRQPRIPDS